MSTGPSRAALDTTCRRKPRRPLLKRSSTSPRLEWIGCARLPSRKLRVVVEAALHHYAQPFRRARDAGVEPACTAVLERKTLVEQHHVVPLRALRFVHGQHIAVVELVIRLALLPWDRLDRTPKTVAADRDFRHFVAEVFIGRQPHDDDLRFRLRARLHPPQTAIEKTFLAVVAQADQLVSGDRQRVLDVLLLPPHHFVGAAGYVPFEQHLAGPHHPVWVKLAALRHRLY